MSLLDVILEFFETYIFTEEYFDYGNTMTFNIGGHTITLAGYLTYTCALISIILIVIMCALFVYKIIKTIGGLIR